ncbi:hypothetical protein HYZ97_02795 [Candidatus Pacearchaeota archaeon]|nr:hypothetical protein [Candidatus Pacearchaeota archaeon]
MKIKNENEKTAEIGMLLFSDAENNPLQRLLNIKKLNFSLESLREVDNYIEKLRKNKKELKERDIKRVILRCGTYLGEIIRRSNHNFIWITYDAASKISKEIKAHQKNLLNHLILYDLQKERFWFPLNKVYKFLEYGRGDNLWSFATVALDRTV